MTKMPGRSLVGAVAILVFLTTLAFAQDFKSGVERWPIKTSVPQGAKLDKPQTIDYADLVKVDDPPGVTKNDHRYQDKLVPEFPNTHLAAASRALEAVR
jgi:hypothetical protein